MVTAGVSGPRSVFAVRHHTAAPMAPQGSGGQWRCSPQCVGAALPGRRLPCCSSGETPALYGGDVHRIGGKAVTQV